MARYRTTEAPLIRYYRDLLGVGPGYSPEELKKQFRKLALLFHPDHNSSPNARADFEKMRSAYEVLSRPERVRELNRVDRKSKFSIRLVDGLTLTFGNFFGYRSVSAKDEPTGVAIDFEENQSILDHPAYDAIEVAFAGRLTPSDEDSLINEKFNLEGFGKLPWVLLNNQGVLDFQEGRFQRALRSYQELVRRIPNNIVFLYRLAVCEIVVGSQSPQRDWLGRLGPPKKSLKKAKALLTHAIQLGAERSVGKQRCEVPRKLLADVEEWLGNSRASQRLWRRIQEENPRSIEAELKVNGPVAARKLLQGKTQEGEKQKLLLASSKVFALPWRKLKSR